ncbi:anti-CBASS protein Acb1 family protein, partial [Vibrio lentus]
AGMSGDTNDGDIRNWNGYLNTRLGEVEDNMSLVDEILIRDTLGSYPDDIEYTWKPLDVLTETERAKAKKDNVDAAKGAIESQIIAPEEARQLFEDDPDFSLDETK